MANEKKTHIINDEKNAPRVTVGIMAYNEEKYLAKTIESVLQQDFSDYYCHARVSLFRKRIY